MSIYDDFKEATTATTVLGHWDVEDYTNWKEWAYKLASEAKDLGEARKLLAEAAAHMAHHAPDPAPFDQPLWQRLNEQAMGYYAYDKRVSPTSQ